MREKLGLNYKKIKEYVIRVKIIAEMRWASMLASVVFPYSSRGDETRATMC